MRQNRRVFLQATALAAAGGCIAGCNPAARTDDGAPANDGGVGGKEVRKIPLAEIYSTNGQKGIKEASAGFRLGKEGTKNYIEPYGATLAEIEHQYQGGASNAFLVRGRDITAAVGATWK